MATEKLEDVATPNTLLREYCPICAAVMTKQDVEGVLCWVCPDPECGYIEPV